jgi:arylsulfatase A-like enzyme
LKRRAIWLAAAIAAWGCGEAAAPSAPPVNLLLISLDTLRADHVGAVRAGRSITPHLDELARDGVVFSECISSAPVTLPAHASILTSLHPSHHAASNGRRTQISESVTTLGELLVAAGYRTASFNGGIQLDRAWGVGRGFEVFESVHEWNDPTLALAGPENRMRAVVAKAREWIGAESKRPFFLFLHSYEIHHPYNPDAAALREVARPYSGGIGDAISLTLLRQINAGEHPVDAEDVQHIVDTYSAELLSADRALGELFAFLREQGLYDDTLIVFTSDHGEEFGEHGMIGWHSHTLYDELLRVPLIFKFPRSALAGRVVAGQVRAIDIAPTALAALGLPAPAQFEGVDLAAAARAGRADGLVAVSQEDGRPKAPASLRTRRWKFHDGKLFDLLADPGEAVDLAGERPDIVGALRAELERQVAARPEPDVIVPAELDPDVIERLKALGYSD